jgi:hypothetical protein
MNQQVTVCGFPACTCSTRVMCPVVLGHRTFADRVRTFARKWRWQKSQGLERLSLRFWLYWIVTGRYQG